MSPRRPTFAALAAVLALLVAFGLAACGGGDSSSAPAEGADPATVSPADSVLYADATIRPEGTLKDDLDSALSKLLGTSDVGSTIVDRLDKELQKDDVSYEDDIQPWLGSRAGFFLSKIAPGNGSDGAFVVSTTDASAAQDAVSKLIQNSSSAGDGKVTHETYKGVDYSAQDSGAFGMVGDLLVLGTKGGFEAAVDASQGSSLADSSGYTSAIASAPDDRLATFYLDPKGLLDAVAASGRLSAQDAQGLGFIRTLGGKAGQEPVVGWADVTADSFGVELSAAAQPGAKTGAPLLAGFPADAWLAFGTHAVGDAFNRGIEALSRIPAAAMNGRTPAQALRIIRAKTGVDVAGFSKWLGDVSGYVSGTGLFSLGGALVFHSTDAKASSQTLEQVQRILERDADLSVTPLSGGGFKVVPQSAPIEIDVQQQDGKIVAGLGAGSLDDALSPSSTLGDNSAFKSAEDRLGDSLTPTVYLDFDPIVGLIASASADPQIEQAKPYLDRLDYVVAGTGVSGGRQLARLVLGVRESNGTTGDTTAAITAP